MNQLGKVRVKAPGDWKMLATRRGIYNVITSDVLIEPWMYRR